MMSTQSHAAPLLEARGVGRIFGEGPLATRVLHPSTLALEAGEVAVLRGPSGSGKTTLLSILGLVLTPSEGEVWLEGRRVSALSRDDLARVRLRHIGFVFQQFNLLSGLTALENVALPLELLRVPPRERAERAATALARVRLASHSGKKPRELSGGQQQRVAIARAIIADPQVVLCDEPTAALDAEAGAGVLDLLRELASHQRRAVMIVTHDERVLRIADRIVEVSDGRVTSGSSSNGPDLRMEPS